MVDNKLDIRYVQAAEVIKNAILSAQYEAQRGANSIQLMLYYSVGRYVSQNTRHGKWGTNATGTISHILRRDMPGLRGFSESNIKRMRTFYEEWQELDAEVVDCNSPIQTGELGMGSQTADLQQNINSSIQTDEFPETVSLIQTSEIQILPFNFPVATYKTATDMPEHIRKALPDQEDLLKLMKTYKRTMTSMQNKI